ncbi:hypothetical protein ACEPPN_003985 [Leptodophora sp. 'Broadleaf-Isolate-01']
MNNEAKVRRSTKSVVLGKGKAKVMSYEDTEEARATRVAKDAMKGKGKRGRKRKSVVLEADEPEAEAEEPEVARARGHRGQGETWSEAQEAEELEPAVARMIDVPKSRKAPLARIF